MSDYSFNPAPVRRVAIIGGNRIPFARSNSVYAKASNHDMLTATLQGLVDRFNLHGQRLGEVVGGAVIPVLTGLLADATTLAASLTLPALCYVAIAAFALLRGRRYAG